jgi:restriction system protein
LQAKGRKANVTENGADGGVDVLLYSTSEPEKVVGVVQCKAWTKQLVGVKEVRELLGIMTDAGCPHGIYLTTSGYTAEAKAFAEGKQIHLRDSAQLLTLIKTLSVEKQDKILKQITAGDYTTPSCPNCGVKLVARGSKKANRSGQWFWGCPGFPRCRYTMRRPRAV